MEDCVTVVIPTRNRPQLVVRAVRSALAQTCGVARVVVVVDGPDDATADALRDVGDKRIEWLVLPHSGGANNARNIGAAVSTTEWIAFLDDDDEWLPHKIETQLAHAVGVDIVSCRCFAQSSNGTMIWPRRLPAEGMRFGDYLFARRSVFNGEAAILTSTLMIRKTLFDSMPFSTELRRHQDADWVIQATSRGARIVYAPEALVRFNDDIGRVRISTSYQWRESLEWIRSIRPLLSRQAYAGFVLTSVAPAASDKREWREFVSLLWDALVKGRPTLLHLALYFGMWCVPQHLRQRFRAHLSSIRVRRPLLIPRPESSK